VEYELKDTRQKPNYVQKEEIFMSEEQENTATETAEVKIETAPPETETVLQTEAPVADTEPQPETETATPAEEPQNPLPADEFVDEKTEINHLLDEGYSVKQIIELGFKRRTAYHYAKLRVKPENEPASGSDTTAVGSNGKGRHDMIKLGSKDVIPPEAVMEVLHLPQNGDAVEVWRRGVLDGVGILLLGARYSQLTAAGQAEIVKNQLDIMREAKDNNKDIARQAAQETAIEMANLIVQKIPKPEPSSQEPNIADRMLGPMADMAGKQMANMFGKMFGFNPEGQNDGEQPQMPSGWEYEDKGGTKQ